MRSRMQLLGAVAGALLLTAGAAHAALEEADFTLRSTEDLVDLCSARADSAMGTAAVNFCHGFAQGAVSVEMQRAAASRMPKIFCIPSPTPSRNETLAEFVRWAQASPARMQQKAADGLFSFLKERFPCQRGS